MKHNWEYKRLGEVCEKASSNLAQKDLKFVDEGFPVFGASGQIGNLNFYHRSDPYIGIVKDGSGVGRTQLYPAMSSLLGTLQYIIPSSSVLPEFLCYAIQSLNLSKYVNGAAIPHIYFRDYKRESIPVPPMEVQEHIVAELDELNGVIDAKREQLKQLDLLAQSIFYTMFGDPVTNPKGWKTTKWELLFDTILGKMLDKNKQIDSDEILPYLANQNVQWGSFNLDNLNTMTFSVKEKSKFKLKKGDILICEGGESGRCAIWQDDESDILFQKAVHRARIKDLNAISPYFIRFWLEYLKKNDGLKNYIVKSTIEHLTGMKLKTLPVHVPPLSLQQQFAVKVEAIEAQKADIEASIKQLQTLLDSRMDYWFN